MRVIYILLISTLLISYSLISNGQDIKRIEIEYVHGWYSFGKIGKYETNEKIVISPISSNNYEFDSFVITEKYQTILKTTRIKKRKNRTREKINHEQIKSLIDGLSTDKYPIRSTNFNYNEYLNRINLQKIKKNARYDYNTDWLLRQCKSDTAKLNEHLRNIKKSECLDTFLISSQKREYNNIIPSDLYHYLDIKVYVDNDTVLYGSNLWDNEFWGQPFVDSYKARNDTIVSANNSVFNLDINLTLLEFIPKKSSVRKVLAIDKFLNYYIDWYAEKAHKDYTNKNRYIFKIR